MIEYIEYIDTRDINRQFLETEKEKLKRLVVSLSAEKHILENYVSNLMFVCQNLMIENSGLRNKLEEMEILLKEKGEKNEEN